ncbi:MAG: hypothetical protein J6M27_11290 [Lachnospiraceae bacterium]|nr:hypothetical protein [Lachnospiraceae bacterium]
MENMEEEKKSILDRMQGKWYEQRENGAVITIEKDHITYESSGESTSGSFRLHRPEEDGDDWDILTGGGFKTKWDMFEKLIFHASRREERDWIQSRLNMLIYDMQYTPRSFERTPYETPKYGEVHIKTNEKAIKWFQDYRVRKLCLKVQEPQRPSTGMMAPMPPYAGYYTFEIERTENDGGILRAMLDRGGCAPDAVGTMGFAAGMMMMGMQDRGVKIPDVEVSPAEMNELALCIANGKLDQLNGLDAWQDGVPAGTESFDLSIRFFKESYHARANHIFVPKEWQVDGKKLHLFLLKLLIRAGLDYGRMEFHSTKALLRIKTVSRDAAYCITLSQEGREKEEVSMQGEAYAYEVSYPVGRWKMSGEVPEALKNALDALMQQINKEEKARGLWLYDAMAKIGQDVREAKRPPYYASRLLGDFDGEYGKNFFWFRMLRAESYSLPIEGGLQNKDPFGDHKSYCFDTEDGHFMSVADFYTDVEKLIDILIGKVSGNYSEGNPMYKKLVSPAYRETLRQRLTTPETLGGMGFCPGNAGMNISFQNDLDENCSPWITDCNILYKETQELLNPRYATMAAGESYMPFYGMM